MKEYKLKTVAISEIKTAPYNPASRIKKENLTKLKKSIEEIGLIYPLAVTAQNELIDGHRRLQVCRELGWEEIQVIVVNGNRDSIYADVNGGTARKLTGAEALAVFLSNPEAVSARSRRYFQTVEEAIGRDLLKKIARNGLSIHIYRWGRELSVYCSLASDMEFTCKAIEWMLKFKSSFAARQAMNIGTSPKVIIRAITRNEELTMKYTAVRTSRRTAAA